MKKDKRDIEDAIKNGHEHFVAFLKAKDYNNKEAIMTAEYIFRNILANYLINNKEYNPKRVEEGYRHAFSMADEDYELWLIAQKEKRPD